MPIKRAIIVGGGLAGLSCAFRLIKEGFEVTVLESRNVVGGRTSSWNENDMEVESGLHKFLGIYRALPTLLQDVCVKTNDILSWVDELAFLMPDGEEHLFKVAPYSDHWGQSQV